MKEEEGRTDRWLRELLDRQREQGLRRILPEPLPEGWTDLRSNDHLGLSGNEELQQRIRQAMEEGPLSGSTGSRLISGNSRNILDLEAEMAAHYKASAGLLFNSGYQANVGLISALGGRKTTLLYDEKVHASMRDGIRLSLARSRSFSHNDPDSLEEQLAKAEGPTFVLVEGLYSMDGDEVPLEAFVRLAERYDASLVLDEAHSNGVLGPSGEGIAAREGLEDRIFVRIFPFGKAFAQQGAFVAGSELLREFLINHARSFIYSTAPSFPALIALRESFRYVRKADEEREALFERIAHFRRSAEKQGIPVLQDVYGPIQGILMEGNEAVQGLEQYLWERGFAVKGIRRPTVPEGSERIRVVIHADTPFDRIEAFLGLSKQ